MTLLHIDSKFRNSGIPDDFTFSFTAPKSFKQVKLLSVHIPMSMYVINLSNNIITFSEASSPLVNRRASLTPGNYSSLSLTGEIKSRMDAAGTQAYNVTFDDITNHITISAPAPFTLKFSIGNNPSSKLGFNNGSDTVSATSHTGPGLLNLSPSGIYFLTIDGFGITNVITSHQTSVPGHYPLCLIGVSDDFIQWTNDETFPPVNVSSISGHLRIRLVDSDGQPAMLNRNWSITLELK